MRAIILAVTIFCVTSFYAPLSTAQSKKELAAQNAALALRLERLEGRMLTGDPAAEALMSRMDAIQTANRNLTGEVERLRFERDNLRAEVKALAEDIREMQELSSKFQIHLDAVELVAQQGSAVRSNAPRTYSGAPAQAQNYGNHVSGGGIVDAPTHPQLGPGQVPAIQGPPTVREVTVAVQGDYNDISALPAQGRTKLAEGDFSGAQSLFQQYLNLNPEAEDAGTVSFWLGESYFVKGGYADAADAYIQSMRTDRNGIKAPEAMVRLAASLRELGNKAQACQTLDSFPSQYPDASETVRNKRLLEMSRTGC